MGWPIPFNDPHYDAYALTQRSTWVEDASDPGHFFWRSMDSGVVFWNGGRCGDAQINDDRDWRYRAMRVTADAIRAIAADKKILRDYCSNTHDEMYPQAVKLVATWDREGGPGVRRRYGPMWSIDP